MRPIEAKFVGVEGAEGRSERTCTASARDLTRLCRADLRHKIEKHPQPDRPAGAMRRSLPPKAVSLLKTLLGELNLGHPPSVRRSRLFGNRYTGAHQKPERLGGAPDRSGSRKTGAPCWD